MHTLNSIRARLTAAFVLATGAAVIITCSLLVGYSLANADSSVDHLLNTAHSAASRRIANTAHPESAEAWIIEFGQWLDAEDMAAEVIGKDGSLRAKTQPNVPTWPRTSDGWRVVTVSNGEDTLVIGFPWQHKLAAIRTQAILLGTLGMLVIIVTGGASWALVGQTLLPIRMLTRQAQAASSDNLRLRLAAPTKDDEVAELVSTLNGLLERLADTVTTRGRFYAAASHELRTPLQALSGHLELALNRDRSAVEYRTMLEEARIQTQRLTVLTQDVLFLNKLDTGSLPAPQPVELSELCERLFTHFQALAGRRRLTPQISLIEVAMIDVPPLHVEMLVRNLIENAVKYASAGGTIGVSLAEEHGQCRLVVFNSFPAEVRLDPDALFEPFFRPDASRNMETGGNGLGLAICRALTTANQWKFDWRQDADGVRATIWFPATT